MGKSNGFTLVEILVVVVIVGILAAVAVPKLFGTVAKAKASEIPPAAGMYVKLQNLYLSEKGAVGNWKSIGYVAPGSGSTKNFTYCGGEIDSDIEAEQFGNDVTAKIGWQATNNVSLNDCSASHWWFVSVKPVSGAEATFAYETNAAECIALAQPNWTVSKRSGIACGVAGLTPEQEQQQQNQALLNPIADGTKESFSTNLQSVVASLQNAIGSTYYAYARLNLDGNRLNGTEALRGDNALGEYVEERTDLGKTDADGNKMYQVSLYDNDPKKSGLADKIYKSVNDNQSLTTLIATDVGQGKYEKTNMSINTVNLTDSNGDKKLDHVVGYEIHYKVDNNTVRVYSVDGKEVSAKTMVKDPLTGKYVEKEGSAISNK